jgi:hypothetical protein
MPGDLGPRLNSWKQIARHLGRDVRTVRRWELKDVGMPVHRVPGGRSVFAYARELDAWLLEGSPEAPAQQSPLRRVFVFTAAVVSVALLVALASKAAATDSANRVVTLTGERDRLAARGVGGEVLWTVEHPSGRLFSPASGDPRTILDVWGIAGGGMLVADNTAVTDASGPYVGELFHLSNSGEVLWMRSLDETLRFGDVDYSGPWSSGFLYSPGAESDLVFWGVHHATWWPSLTLALLEDGSVAGTFINSGWVTAASLLPGPEGDRLLLGGVSNSQRGAMLAELPHPLFSGRSPEVEGSAFECEACPDGQPLKYFVLPPTHVNQASGLPYNRTTDVQASNSGVTVIVQEGPPGTDIQWVYNFSGELAFLRATPSDTYGPRHILLEREGVIDHSWEDCPERESVEVRVWTPEAGWASISSRTGPVPRRD